MTTTETLKLALEALENAEYGDYDKKELNKAITALREALASEAIEQKSGIKQVIELYDSPDQPPQRQARSADTWVNATTWRGLTAEERNTICENAGTWREAMKVIEAKLKEKNT